MKASHSSRKASAAWARRLLAAVVLLAAFGCGSSSLSVRVSVLDPIYLEKYRGGAPIETVVARARLAARSIQEGAFSQTAIDEVTDNARQLVRSALEEARVEAEVKALLPDYDSLESIAADAVRNSLEAARDELRQGITSVREAQSLPASHIDEALKLYGAASRHFSSAERKVGTIGPMLQKDLEVVIDGLRYPASAEAAREKLSKVARDVGARSKNLADDQRRVAYSASGDFLGDPLLGYVLKAPDSNWRAILNIARASVAGSNSDVAIVMDDIAKFSVKGVRADSTAVTAATFTTLSRVMSIAAAVSGVPVPGLVEGGRQSSSASTSSGDDEESRQRRLVSRAQLEDRASTARQRLVRLLDAVLEQGPTAIISAEGDSLADLQIQIAARLQATAQ